MGTSSRSFRDGSRVRPRSSVIAAGCQAAAIGYDRMDQGRRRCRHIVEAPRTLHPARRDDPYAHVIEEANDDAVRRARVDAMYADSTMAVLMAAAERNS